MVKRKEEIQVELMNEEDIKYWAENVVAPDPDNGEEERDEQLAHRVVNLADVTSIVSYLVRVNSQELYHAMKQQSTDIIVLRNIILEELEVPEDVLDEYEEEVKKKLAANEKVVELMREMLAKGEEITEEDMKRINKEVEKLSREEE